MENRAKVLVIATGGTIASAISEKGALSPQLGVEELKNMLLDSKNRSSIDITLLQLMNKDSTNINPDDWDKIINALKSNLDKYDGFIVLHGTDTMAYSASAVSFALKTEKPIVFTGSMLPANKEGSDAKGNFNLALREAAGNGLGAGGVLIAFDGEVIPGNNATKIDTLDFKAFGLKSSKVDLGLVSIVHETFRTESALLRDSYPLLEKNFDEKVISIHLTPGISPEMLMNISKNADGIVLEAFGSGGLPDNLLGAVSEISKEKPVVMVTQVSKGEVNLDEYDVGKNAKAAGVIDGQNMTIEAASTKLMWALARTRAPSEIRRIMYTNISGELDQSSAVRARAKETQPLQKLHSLA